MSPRRRALVMHLTGGGEPVLVALTEQTADELRELLPELLESGAVHTVTAANDIGVAVNFSHVASAHIDALPPLATVYGT